LLRDGFQHGYPPKVWEAAKDEAKAAMIERAKVRGMLAYSDLTKSIQSIAFEPHSAPYFHFLGEICEEEDLAGRGMLTAIVVHKSGDMEPGPGFYELAKHLGRDTRDKTKCWIEELHKVHAYWTDN
jgi:hypothetical protein